MCFIMCSQNTNVVSEINWDLNWKSSMKINVDGHCSAEPEFIMGTIYQLQEGRICIQSDLYRLRDRNPFCSCTQTLPSFIGEEFIDKPIK